MRIAHHRRRGTGRPEPSRRATRCPPPGRQPPPSLPRGSRRPACADSSSKTDPETRTGQCAEPRRRLLSPRFASPRQGVSVRALAFAAQYGLPTVVLPQPDSPTRAMGAPDGTGSETPSTARTSPSSVQDPPGGPERDHQIVQFQATRVSPPRSRISCRLPGGSRPGGPRGGSARERSDRCTRLPGSRRPAVAKAWPQRSASGSCRIAGQRRDEARDLRQPPPALTNAGTANKRLGVGMPRLWQQRLRAALHQLAGIHHAHAVGHSCHHAQVVRDQAACPCAAPGSDAAAPPAPGPGWSHPVPWWVHRRSAISACRPAQSQSCPLLRPPDSSNG